jgi:hypothetical protein
VEKTAGKTDGGVIDDFSLPERQKVPVPAMGRNKSFVNHCLLRLWWETKEHRLMKKYNDYAFITTSK